MPLSNTERPQVRILIYADGFFDFLDLTHIRALLEAGPFPHISFKVTSAHRDESHSEDAKIDLGPVKLTDLHLMEDFDEIWYFGADTEQELLQEEKDLLTRFMQAPKFGGVFVTGDHGPLGQLIGEAIPRAGAMRRWDIPPFGPNRNSSLVEGPDNNTTFTAQDEADDIPQLIHYLRFPLNAPAGVPLQPHPVLSGPDGPIDVLPDHEHEGQAIAPEVNDANAATWPKNQDGTHQEQPVVIAFGDIKDPQLQSRRFGVISAYNGHTVDVGRIIADSSWHHWLDSNLSGFEPTPAGQAALRKIEAYFLNCGAWLAPRDVQAQVRNAAWSYILSTKEIKEIPADAPLNVFGERAIKELRRFASSGAVSEWILGPDKFNKVLSDPQFAQLSENSSLLNLSVEQYLAGGIIKALRNEANPVSPQAIVPATETVTNPLEQAIKNGTANALSTIQQQLASETQRFQTAVDRLRGN